VWVKGILTSETSPVLLNGTPEKVFYCRKRCLARGSSIPLLFVLVVDMLQSIINKAKDMGLLKLPLNVGYTTDFPIIQYAYDTILIMEAWPL
jgi:hypothetical protein